MIKKEKTQEQFELFSRSKSNLGNRDSLNKNSRNSTIILGVDNIVIISISIILALIFSFSIGVEKGKRISFNQITKRPEQKEIQQTIKLPQPVKQPIKEKIEASTEDKNKITKYTVQVATYKTDSHVKKEAQRLKKQGYDTTVVPNGKWKELCVGNFNDRSQAKISLKKLKKKYRDCFIRRL